MQFANLHNHTDLGSFDSIMTPKKFAERLKNINQEHLVQTDHGTLRGMVTIAKEAYKNGLKYIPGLEAYVTFQNPQKTKDEFERLYYHMLLIAKDNKGLLNLQRLIALSYQPDHMYYKPRLGLQEIFDHSEGLIATSGCLASLTSCTIMAEANGVDSINCAQCHSLGHPCDDHHVPEDVVLNPELKGARSLDNLLDKFTKYFKEDFYLELQDSGAGDEQDLVNRVLIDASKKKGIPLIATSDAHYSRPEEAKLRSMVLRIRHGKSAEEAADESFYEEGRIYLKTGEELAELFGDEPIKNTIDLVNKCNVDLDFNKTYFPAAEIPKDYIDSLQINHKELSSGALEDKYLYDLLFKSLESIRESLDQPFQVYKERLEEELSTISQLGFSAYFLVLKEILDWCKENKILVGPGRGSAAGSLAAYLAGITNIDPIKYGLFFSRFLNKARVSWPDIDVDLPKDKREEVIRYVVEKYGDDKVCQIMTFSSMKPKGMARDIARTLGLEALGNEIAELIPPPLHGKDPTVEVSLEQEPKLKDEKYKIILEKMQVLEGLTRTTGVHAAGVVISPKSLSDICPVEFQGKKKDKPVAQLDMNELESLGLVKMDFLGLRNLEVINNCIQMLPDNILLSANEIPMDDPATYENLRTTGEFGGLFQFEGSAAIGNLLHQIRPENLEDIAIATALFRPGPLGAGLDKKLISNKNDPNYSAEDPYLEKITEDTYGCLIYQEQLMKMCVEIAGFSEEDADQIRKVLGKKKKEEVEKWRKPFVEGCQRTSNVSEHFSDKLFENIQSGADYLFNKSHAIAYSLISYWCAYLRTHYPSEFMAAVLNASFDNKDKLINALKACKNLNINVTPPQIKNLTEICSPVDKNTVQLGLAVCKYLKKGSKDAILASKYKPETLVDFFATVNRSKFNSGKAVALAKGGILDELAKKSELTRTGLIEAIPFLYEHFKVVGNKIEQHQRWKERKERRMEQEFLKAQGKDYGKRMVSVGKEPEIPPSFDFTPYQNIPKDLLAIALGEYEILGLCLGFFPTDFMNKTSKAMSIEEAYLYGEEKLLANGGFSWSKQINLNLAGIVTQFKEHLTRKKKMRATFLLEDHTGIVECNVFTKAYEKLRHKLEDRTCIECECTVLGAENNVLEVAVNNYRILKPLENMSVPKRASNFDIEAENHIQFADFVEQNQNKLIRFKNILYKGGI